LHEESTEREISWKPDRVRDFLVDSKEWLKHRKASMISFGSKVLAWFSLSVFNLREKLKESKKPKKNLAESFFHPSEKISLKKHEHLAFKIPVDLRWFTDDKLGTSCRVAEAVLAPGKILISVDFVKRQFIMIAREDVKVEHPLHAVLHALDIHASIGKARVKTIMCGGCRGMLSSTYYSFSQNHPERPLYFCARCAGRMIQYIPVSEITEIIDIEDE
jgi:hypothetical protein